MPDDLRTQIADLRRLKIAAGRSPHEAALIERIRSDQAYRDLCTDLAPALADEVERLREENERLRDPVLCLLDYLKAWPDEACKPLAELRVAMKGGR